MFEVAPRQTTACRPGRHGGRNGNRPGRRANPSHASRRTDLEEPAGYAAGGGLKFTLGAGWSIKGEYGRGFAETLAVVCALLPGWSYE